MYNPDAHTIAEFAAQKPENAFRVGLFVISTINQHFERVPFMLDDWAQFGMQSAQYMRWQKKGISELAATQDTLHSQVLAWQKQGKRARHKALRHMVERTGFGVIKAAFYVQLVLPDCGIGCLDRHNLKMYGLSPTAFSAIPTSVSGLTHKINTYLALSDRLGGSESLWNNWCNYLAAIRPHVFACGEEVSRLHVTCMVGM